MSLTRTASCVLAFGFFFITACSTQIHTIDGVRKQFIEGDAKSALASTNELLRKDPGNSRLLYLKAGILKDLADAQTDPAGRFPYYREMKSSLDQLSDTAATALLNSRDNLIAAVWKKEQEDALDRYALLQEDYSPEELIPVISHYENALLVNPDSSATYNLKATAYYRMGDLQNAVKTLQTADSVLNPVPPEMKEKLAFLLLEEGQLQTSISIYRQLLLADPENDKIKHGLVNAYILDGRHENSIRLLRELLENDAGNLTYHEALTTELFFHIQESVRHMVSAEYSAGEILSRHEALMEELDEAEKHYRTVQDEHPNRNEITFVTAAFYKNTASHLMKLADLQDEDISELLHEKARDLLARSIPVWKSVVERNPENPEVWRSMYQIYSHLNMDQEAAEAYSKANL